MDITQLMAASYRIATEHGWWDTGKSKTFGECIALIHGEVSEALQEYRYNHGLNEIYNDEEGAPHGVPIELADAVIRIADLCQHFDIDLQLAINLKMEFNEHRPYRHGDKRL